MSACGTRNCGLQRSRFATLASGLDADSNCRQAQRTIEQGRPDLRSRRDRSARTELWPVKSLSPMLLGLFADRFGPALGHLVEMPPDLLLSATKSPKTLLDLLNGR